MIDDDAIQSFWGLAGHHIRVSPIPGYLPSTTLEAVPPPAWSFGRTPEQADALLDLVLAGTKTATASALAEYGDDGPLPEPGTLGILLDGRGHPRALIATTVVEVVPFAEVDAEHARLEGEGDRTLEHWRRVHEEFFSVDGAVVDAAFPVVLEQFKVLYPRSQ